MTIIAFLGLGAMGQRMAARLVGEFDVVVYNRTASRADELVAAGARRAETPADAARGADIVWSMVSDDEAATDLWLAPETGAAHGLGKGALAIESSTVTPSFIATLAAAVGAAGASLLDAPVAGSTPQAEAGALLVLAGGAASDVDRASTAFDVVGARTIHVGEQGQGAVLKLVVNALFAGQVALLSELMRGASALGLQPARLAEMLTGTPVLSPAAGGVMQLMVSGDHAPRFPIDLVAKDLRYAGGFGDTPVVDAARGVFEAAAAAGRGSLNISGV